MRNYTSFLVVVGLALLGFGCTEQEVVIPPLGPPDSVARKVLVEEFTGVKCVNCPQGSAEIENLISLYGDNLVAVSYHAGSFAVPYNESKYDFRTPEGTDILNYIGVPFGYPAAVINRKDFGAGYQLTQAQWAGYVDSEFQESPELTVNLDCTYNPDTREVQATITTVAQQALSGELYSTVMVTESDIKDYQLLPTGKEPDYKHKHVFRDIIDSDAIGKVYANGMAAAEIMDHTLSFTLSNDYVAENCELIVLIHRNDGDNKYVLNVDAEKIVQ